MSVEYLPYVQGSAGHAHVKVIETEEVGEKVIDFLGNKVISRLRDCLFRQ